MPLGPSQGYLAQYNSYTLPGYVQSESFDSVMRIEDHYATYADGSLSEYVGLQNKSLNVTLKVWEPTYLECKTEVEKAATMLRSRRKGFAELYLQRADRYYEALVKTINVEKTVDTSRRTLEYVVNFEAKPWLFDSVTTEFTGSSGTITTTGRTIDHGGWTPTNILVTGTNVTISGYTDGGEFTGYASVSGAVTNLTIDSINFTATIGSANKNAIMSPADYRVFVAPGVTKFAVSGASSIAIRYRNRWHI